VWTVTKWIWNSYSYWYSHRHWIWYSYWYSYW